jgi:hypothetical protein
MRAIHILDHHPFRQSMPLRPFLQSTESFSWSEKFDMTPSARKAGGVLSFLIKKLETVELTILDISDERSSVKRVSRAIS